MLVSVVRTACTSCGHTYTAREGKGRPCPRCRQRSGATARALVRVVCLMCTERFEVFADHAPRARPAPATPRPPLCPNCGAAEHWLHLESNLVVP